MDNVKKFRVTDLPELDANQINSEASFLVSQPKDAGVGFDSMQYKASSLSTEIKDVWIKDEIKLLKEINDNYVSEKDLDEMYDDFGYGSVSKTLTSLSYDEVEDNVKGNWVSIRINSNAVDDFSDAAKRSISSIYDNLGQGAAGKTLTSMSYNTEDQKISLQYDDIQISSSMVDGFDSKVKDIFEQIASNVVDGSQSKTIQSMAYDKSQNKLSIGLCDISIQASAVSDIDQKLAQFSKSSLSSFNIGTKSQTLSSVFFNDENGNVCAVWQDIEISASAVEGFNSHVASVVDEMLADVDSGDNSKTLIKLSYDKDNNILSAQYEDIGISVSAVDGLDNKIYELNESMTSSFGYGDNAKTLVSVSYDKDNNILSGTYEDISIQASAVNDIDEKLKSFTSSMYQSFIQGSSSKTLTAVSYDTSTNSISTKYEDIAIETSAVSGLDNILNFLVKSKALAGNMFVSQNATWYYDDNDIIHTYSTLKDALLAHPDFGKTINILEDMSFNYSNAGKTLYLNNGNNIVFDLNGHTISADYKYSRNCSYQLTDDCLATIVNNTNVTFKNGTIVQDVELVPVFNELSSYAIGDLVIYDNRLYEFSENHDVGSWNEEQCLQCDIFSPSISYSIGDIVYYENAAAIYQCISNHTGAWSNSHFRALRSLDRKYLFYLANGGKISCESLNIYVFDDIQLSTVNNTAYMIMFYVSEYDPYTLSIFDQNGICWNYSKANSIVSSYQLTSDEYTNSLSSYSENNISANACSIYVDQNSTLKLTNSHHGYNQLFWLFGPNSIAKLYGYALSAQQYYEQHGEELTSNLLFSKFNTYACGRLLSSIAPHVYVNGNAKIEVNYSYPLISADVGLNYPMYGTYMAGNHHVGALIEIGNAGNIEIQHGHGIYSAQENVNVVIHGGKVVGDNGITIRSGKLSIPSYANPTVIGTGNYFKYNPTHKIGEAGAALILGHAIMIESNSDTDASYGRAYASIQSGTFISKNNTSIASVTAAKAPNSWATNKTTYKRVENFVEGGLLNRTPSLDAYALMDQESATTVYAINTDYNIIADGFTTSTPTMIIKQDIVD